VLPLERSGSEAEGGVASVAVVVHPQVHERLGVRRGSDGALDVHT